MIGISPVHFNKCSEYRHSELVWFGKLLSDQISFSLEQIPVFNVLVSRFTKQAGSEVNPVWFGIYSAVNDTELEKKEREIDRQSHIFAFRLHMVKFTSLQLIDVFFQKDVPQLTRWNGYATASGACNRQLYYVIRLGHFGQFCVLDLSRLLAFPSGSQTHRTRLSASSRSVRKFHLNRR